MLVTFALSSALSLATTVYEQIYISTGGLGITNPLTNADIGFDLYNDDTDEWVAGGHIDAFGYYHYETFGSVGVQFGGGDAVVDSLPAGNYTVAIWGNANPPLYSLWGY